MSGPSTACSRAFDHRVSIIAYLEDQAARKEASGQRTTATEFRAVASSIAALLDINAGKRDIAGPVQAIIRETVSAFGAASYAEIVGPSKGSQDAIRIRFAAMWVAKKRLGWGDERMEADFNRDRSTIHHGVTRAEEIRLADEEYRRVTDELVAQDIRCEHCLTPLVQRAA